MWCGEAVRGAGGVGADQHLRGVRFAGARSGVFWQRGQRHGPGSLTWSAVVLLPGVARAAGSRRGLHRRTRRVVQVSTAAGGSRRSSSRSWLRLLLLRMGDHDRGVDVRSPHLPAASGRRPPRSGSWAQALPRRAADGPQPGQMRAASTRSTHRHAVASEATGPNSSGLIAQHRQIGEGLPAVGDHHRQVHARPGPGRARPRAAPATPPRPSAEPLVSPVASARSASSRAPACPTTPRPSAVTMIFGRDTVAFTRQVPSVNGCGP